MKRKLLSLMLVLAMVLTVFPVAAFAAGGTAVEEGGIAYEIKGNVARVTGLAKNTTTVVEIPAMIQDKPVVAIEKNAFKGTNIISVSIPEKVETIGDSAFEGCKKLTEVIFEGAYADLGKNCFKDCTGLEALYVPEMKNGVVAAGTFAGCTSLVAVIVEYGNLKIEEGAFADCAALEYIYLAPSVQQIYTEDFKDLKDVVVGGNAGAQGELSTAQKFAKELKFTFDEEEYPNLVEGWFSDVKTDAYYSMPVLWAAATGVTTGFPDGDFHPFESCTRAQMVTFLWRFCGAEKPKTSVRNYYFADVSKSSKCYYRDAVQWAYEQGIINGMDKDKFCPDVKVNRAMVVTMLHRLNQKPAATATTTKFKDADMSAKSYYRNALLWATENGVVKGRSETSFDPNAVCTRADILTFLYRNIYYWNASTDASGAFVS